MLFLQFCLSYILIVNESNAENIAKQSYKMPALVLIYSPHCGHCVKVHPIWKDLLKKYESDTNILISECNAIQYRKECKKIFSYTGFPTFVKIINGESKSFSPTRTIESFIIETEKLKKLNLSTSCSIFQSDFNEKYPSFVLTNNNSNTKKCNLIQEIIDAYPESKPRLYINSTQSKNESFKAITSPGQIIQYEGPIEIQSILNFMTDVILKPFASWNYSEASLGNKRIGLLIHHSDKDFEPFQKVVKPFFNSFSLCKIYSSTFEHIFPNLKFKKSYLPAFAISNEKKTKFVILINVLKNSKFIGLLNDAADGKLDEKAKYDFSALFPISEKVREEMKKEEEKELKKNKLKLSQNPSKLATANFKIILCFVFVVLFSIVVVILKFINIGGNKIE